MEAFLPDEIDLLSLGYAVTLAAYLVRDVLPLRALLALAALIMLGFGWRAELTSMMVWNTLFVAVNAGHLALIIYERRPIRFPSEEARRAWEEVFRILTPQEFLSLWNRGERLESETGVLCRGGARPAWLWLLVSGELRIEQEGELLTRLPPWHLVGEMSFINDSPASADVVIREPVVLVRWPRSELERLMRRQPELGRKLNGAIGQDLVRKLARHNATPEEAGALAQEGEGADGMAGEHSPAR